MSRSRTAFHLATCVLTVMALGAPIVVWTSPVRAADGEIESAKDLDELVARLRNPFFAKQADRDLQIVQLMLRQNSPKADASLRDLLADTGAHPTVVEQITIATLIDGEHRLLPDIVTRLHRESGSELDRALDVAFLIYSDVNLVAKLTEFARDAARPMPLRAEAVELLGRTGKPEALDPLLDFWGGPQKELREPAARAFERILPAGAKTLEEAAIVREEIRNVPFAEALRRLVRRERDQRIGGARAPADDDLVKLARQMLPRATLAQVIESWLQSSSPAVRAMGAKRIAEFPYETPDAAGGPDVKARAARECLAALRHEDVEAAEIELLGALIVLAPELRGAVGEPDLAALTDRVRLSGRASNAVRLAAVRVLAELRDVRTVPVLEETFTALRDGDVELRLALLDALQQAPGDMTSWLIARLSTETHTRVIRKLVVLLNRADDPKAAIDAFCHLLGSGVDQQVRWDVAKALGTLWAAQHLPEARDALTRLGLADPDPTVRRTSAAALGEPGPGRDTIIARLQDVLAHDVDLKVRQAAAKSIVDLDEIGAAHNLIKYFSDDAEIWTLYRDRLVEDVRRRDKTPDRALAAADTLAAASQRRLAIDLLRHVSGPRDGLWESELGRAPMLDRLASLLLDDGDADAAKAVAQELISVLPRDAGTLRARGELLLAMGRCRSGTLDERRSARTSLEMLRAAGTLPAAQRAEADVELGDCLLRLDEPLGAANVLVPAVARTDLPAALTKKAALLLEDAKKRSEEERRTLLAWVDALEGPSPSDAQAGIRGFGVRAAPYLLDALDDARDAAHVRPLVRASELATGRSLAAPADTASDAEVQKAKTEARSVLAKLAPGASPNGAH